MVKKYTLVERLPNGVDILSVIKDKVWGGFGYMDIEDRSEVYYVGIVDKPWGYWVVKYVFVERENSYRLINRYIFGNFGCRWCAVAYVKNWKFEVMDFDKRFECPKHRLKQRDRRYRYEPYSFN